jgi:hypothetical protein
MFHDSFLNTIAKNSKCKDSAQMLIRYALQKGWMVVMTTTIENVEAYVRHPGVMLTNEEMDTLDSMDGRGASFLALSQEEEEREEHSGSSGASEHESFPGEPSLESLFGENQSSEGEERGEPGLGRSKSAILRRRAEDEEQAGPSRPFKSTMPAVCCLRTLTAVDTLLTSRRLQS